MRVLHGAKTMESYCHDCLGNRLSLLGITHELNWLVLQKSARHPATQLSSSGSSRAGRHFDGLRRTRRLRLDFV